MSQLAENKLGPIGEERLLRFYEWVTKPTPRERWQAFWSMFRALRRKGPHQDMALAEATRQCLSAPYLRWFDTMRRIDGVSGDKYSTPLFLRLLMWRHLGYLSLGRKGHRSGRREKP